MEDQSNIFFRIILCLSSIHIKITGIFVSFMPIHFDDRLILVEDHLKQNDIMQRRNNMQMSFVFPRRKKYLLFVSVSKVDVCRLLWPVAPHFFKIIFLHKPKYMV